ncbi:MAG: phage tail protein [Acetobacteraceae bacterium]
MSGSSLTAPSSINGARTKAHLLLGQRLGKLDLTPLLVYTLLNPAPGVLPLLQWQFGLSSPLWALLGGRSSQIALVKQAIPLHRYQGTRYAITTIMAALGFSDITIEEGQGSWGGDAWPSDEGWAVFRVVVNDIASPVTAATQETAVAAINFFKPARCWLDGLWFALPPAGETIPLSETHGVPGQEPPIAITDIFAAPIQPLADTKTTEPFFDAHFYFSGLTYGADEPAIVDSGITISGAPTE